jgi:hypothetical protein
MTISSLRFHWVVEDLALAQERANKNFDMNAKQLWAYTLAESAARACLAILDAQYIGHEAFYIVSPTTVMAESRSIVKGENPSRRMPKSTQPILWSSTFGKRRDSRPVLPAQ